MRNRLRDYRTRQGLTQVGLASAAGVGIATINRLENYPLPVSTSTANKLAAVLGCSVRKLFPQLRRQDGL